MGTRRVGDEVACLQQLRNRCSNGTSGDPGFNDDRMTVDLHERIRFHDFDQVRKQLGGVPGQWFWCVATG